MEQKIEHKGKTYIYGIEKVRDYPKRGNESTIFFIKLKIGYKYFHRYVRIYRETSPFMVSLFGVQSKDTKEMVIKEIEKYIITSRRKKLKRLNK